MGHKMNEKTNEEISIAPIVVISLKPHDGIDFLTSIFRFVDQSYRSF